MKKGVNILFITMFVVLLLCLISCGKSHQQNGGIIEDFDSTKPITSDESDNIKSPRTSVSEDNVTKHEDPAKESQEPSLSKSCDIVFITAYDEGNVYELVANQQEDYNSVSKQYGVIKNNQWLVPLSSDMPFASGTTSIYEVYKGAYKYIGNGCFTARMSSVEELVYNAETQKLYSNNKYPYINHIPEHHKISVDNPFLITYFANYDERAILEFLNTNTMEISKLEVSYQLGVDASRANVCAVSEGCFAITTSNSLFGRVLFFNMQGEMIFSSRCNESDIDSHTLNLEFKKGKCTFDIINDADTPFTVTIDTAGNVLNSVRK